MKEEIIAFKARDDYPCNLVHVWNNGSGNGVKGPVLLVHGAGVRASLFRPPTKPNLVDFLVEQGYDVWLENWRASIDLGEPPEWSLDEAGLYDHPAAVDEVLKLTGASTLKAIIHCQGSTSFMISIMAGLVPQVRTVISNAVSLHPVVPWATAFKSLLFRNLTARYTKYLDAQWGYKEPPPNWYIKLVVRFLQLAHFECLNPVCKMASFSYGIGFPTPVLWRHDNLSFETHEWIKDEFGKVPMKFFHQIDPCFRAEKLLRYEVDSRFDTLPTDYTACIPKPLPRFAFFTGELNRCFLKESQELSFDFFNRLRPDYHSLYILPGYGHLDIFIGKNAAKEVFPIMLAELEK
jgi:pimeloyl-ACP methyl ester carboxylesterase